MLRIFSKLKFSLKKDYARYAAIAARLPYSCIASQKNTQQGSDNITYACSITGLGEYMSSLPLLPARTGRTESLEQYLS